MSNRIIFLDLDGVLNSHFWFKFGNSNYFDPENVRWFTAVLELSGADFCISGTDRRFVEEDELLRRLEAAGCNHRDRYVGKTPYFGGEPRGIEIAHWLSDNPKYLADINNVVILDDDSDMSVMDHALVLTSMLTGMTMSHAVDALRKFRLIEETMELEKYRRRG